MEIDTAGVPAQVVVAAVVHSVEEVVAAASATEVAVVAEVATVADVPEEVAAGKVREEMAAADSAMTIDSRGCCQEQKQVGSQLGIGQKNSVSFDYQIGLVVAFSSFGSQFEYVCQERHY